MRIFIAGASGIIGRALVPLLVARGHAVTGTARRRCSIQALEALGARGVIVDVYDRQALIDIVQKTRPEIVIHQLSDLPDDPAQRIAYGARHARIRREGTRNLVDATLAARARRLIAQSIAFSPTTAEVADATATLERLVMTCGGFEGVILRYGRFYGPGTYFPEGAAPAPAVSIERAAHETVVRVENTDSGIFLITDSHVGRIALCE